MFAARASSFAVGFACASAAGFFVVRKDVLASHERLAARCATLADRVDALERASAK
ncbi:hypothetical protein BE221DRAFT_81933 [Ostreococcus tauri]|uniref:Uncharacterized protein n=1 Tax=Ostreococcus tauri TaxID=70448 RepID=A0A1Y5I8B9_OSTTA|nr:hypothetical protein BE221DRAFT_81933 [Ostreococcus tauri]